VKPILVIGLGNSLVGDDGVGGRLVERLGRDPALRDRADFVAGGCDLLRLADLVEGREAVVLIDALLTDAAPGSVSVHAEPFDDLEAAWNHAHAPSAVQSVALLKAASPALRAIPFTLIGVAVPELRYEAALDDLAQVAGRVREVLRAGPLGRASEG
jgi:hydrogenase maturation protease